jgi:hypothetical protein
VFCLDFVSTLLQVCRVLQISGKWKATQQQSTSTPAVTARWMCIEYHKLQQADDNLMKPIELQTSTNSHAMAPPCGTLCW